MKFVEVPLSSIAWPKCCCKCGSEDYSFRSHTENVVVWTVISVTSYRKITLPIPVCGRCAHRHIRWYGGALLLALAAFATPNFTAQSASYLGPLMAAMLVIAVAMALAGLSSAPINILGYSAEHSTIKVKIKNDRVAEALLRGPGSMVSSHSPVRRVYLYAFLATMVLVVGGAWLARLFG
jgi:hypothetical protein